jgi:hypothetical protein
VALSGALGGWILKVIWDAIKALDRDIKSMSDKLHDEFVRRDDFRESTMELKGDMKEGFRRLEDLIGAVFKRLDGKADKP